MKEAKISHKGQTYVLKQISNSNPYHQEAPAFVASPGNCSSCNEATHQRSQQIEQMRHSSAIEEKALLKAELLDRICREQKQVHPDCDVFARDTPINVIKTSCLARSQ
ncbi:hypothetical protein KIN20_038311 [Parelaphostrongylus tenuis]|uniref:Uncharacterized protein n=1 Tax=Parelaphostrongylus tenuis TaxID=148309 RepID=A0AAD5RIT1_PARTN|nr:hypothetical protein KIN20_038311 [Parelaphostrongylus tenuis]